MTNTSTIASTDITRPLTVGSEVFRNRVFLAPMSGVTDLPFRRLAWKFGAGLVVSEMVASEALLTGQEEMQVKMLRGDMPLHVVQIAGREAKWMGLAAQMAEQNGAQIIDINMGCPARKVTNGYSGSALMRDLDHALTLVEAVVASVKVPVTLKMRLGWDDNSLNAPDLARRAVDAGVQLITVHGRTRCQFYKGNADWDKVRAVREAISVPLVVNGDITDGNSVDKALIASGADAVMIGRGAYGAPWLPGQLGTGGNPRQFSRTDFIDAVFAHYEDILTFYGTELGIRQARKHIGWYLDRLVSDGPDPDLRKQILTSFNPSEVMALMKRAFEISPATGERIAA